MSDRRVTACWRPMTLITGIPRHVWTWNIWRLPIRAMASNAPRNWNRLRTVLVTLRLAFQPRPTIPVAIYERRHSCGRSLPSLRSKWSLCIPAGTPVSSVAPGGITLIGLRPYSSPQCDPMTGSVAPATGVPVFTSVFAQDTIASSAYNSLQVSLDKRFAHGLQFTAAYTFSKSIDEASSFEGILNPLPGAHNRALAFRRAPPLCHQLFLGSAHQKIQWLCGEMLNDWAVSGITTYQTGFPIRITSVVGQRVDEQLRLRIAGRTEQVAPFMATARRTTETTISIPTASPDATNPPVLERNLSCTSPQCMAAMIPACLVASEMLRARFVAAQGSAIPISFVMKNIAVSERTHFEFRGELFNVFNHTQFFNPDGNSTDGTQFGQVTEVKDPRLLQFALKFYF